MTILEKNSISSVARKKHKSEIFAEMPLYTHGFGLDLYETLLSVKDQLPKKLNVLTWAHIID